MFIKVILAEVKSEASWLKKAREVGDKSYVPFQ